MTAVRIWPGILLLAVLAAPGGKAQAPASSQKAELKGTVELEGKPVGKAIVTLVPLAQKGRIFAATAHAIADQAGSFEFKDLEVDDYTACVDVQIEDAINPCIWPDERVSPGQLVAQKAANFPIKLKRGVVLKIRIEDPDGQVESESRGEGRGVVVAGIWSSGQFMAARKVSEDRFGADYQLVVPTGLRVRPYVDSLGVRLVDANGDPVTPASLPTVVATPGQAARFNLHQRLVHCSPSKGSQCTGIDPPNVAPSSFTASSTLAHGVTTAVVAPVIQVAHCARVQSLL